MWVWISTLPTKTAQGTQARLPAVHPTISTSSSRNGNSNACACQMSMSISLPIDQESAAAASSIQRCMLHPPMWRLAIEIPMIDAMLSAPTPIAAPGPGRSVRANGAISRSYSAPGLFMFSPTDSDADVHEPSSGWCSVKTSTARR